MLKQTLYYTYSCTNILICYSETQYLLGVHHEPNIRSCDLRILELLKLLSSKDSCLCNKAYEYSK